MRVRWAALFIVFIPSVFPSTAAAEEEEPPVVVYGPEPPARAPPEPERPKAETTQWLNRGFSVGIGTVVFQPSLGNARFAGSGVPIGGGPRQSYSHLGSEIGIRSPIMWGGELRVDYLQRYFEIGIHGFVAGHPGGADEASNRVAAELADSSSIFGYGAGLRLAAALPAGPVSVSLGPDVGVRGFSVPLAGFEKTTCSSKHGRVPCSEQATAAQPYLQPRLTISWNSGHTGGGLFIAGWIGSDIYPSPTMAGGLLFGVSTPHDSLAP